MFWELIAANRRKSFLLFVGMAVLLVSLGYFIGEATMGEGGGNIGIIVAVGIWVIMSAASVFGGPDLVLRMARARPVTSDVHPQLFNVVEEMKISAGLPAMPKVYIIDERAPNAFATGLRPEDSAIAVTAGLLTKLNRDELQGVIAHETSHIMNRDVQFLTLASIMLGSIVLIAEVFLRGMWYSGGSSKRWRSSKKSEGGGGGLLIIAAIVLAILAPIFARLLYFSISRKREYLADACAVRLTRYPEGLASALEKIAASPLQLEAANKVNAPMFIVAPLGGPKASGWGATHPPIQERIAILRGMSEGAGFLSYQHALAKLRGKPSMILPASAIKKDERIAVREAHPDVVREQTEKDKTRDVMDLMRAVNGFAFLLCACGLKIKVPPEFGEPQIACPRCGRNNEIPKAQVVEFVEVAAAVGAIVGATGAKSAGSEVPFAQPATGGVVGADAPFEYRRRTRGEWESFACGCGHLMQLSPIFSASEMRCSKCGRITRVI